MASCPLGLFVTKGPLCMHTSWRVSGIPMCMRAYTSVPPVPLYDAGVIMGRDVTL